MCLYCSTKLVFTWLYMFGVLFICLYPNVLNAWSLCLDNDQPVVPECVAKDLPEQQPGEGKFPLTHYFLRTYNSPSRITLLKLKDWLVCIYRILVYLLVIMVSFMLLLYLNQWTWCEYLWYDDVIPMMILWYFRVLGTCSQMLWIKNKATQNVNG